MARSASGSFTATGVSDEVVPYQDAVISISGLTAGNGSIALQRKVDGANWRTVKTYTDDAEETVDVVSTERLRLNCAHTSGTFVYYLGAPA